MKVAFGQILTAQEVGRAALTRQVAALLDEGVSVEEVLLDVRDGFAVAGVPVDLPAH